MILPESLVEEWLDPKTTPERALRMCVVFPADGMEVKEVEKEERTGTGKAKRADGFTL